MSTPEEGPISILEFVELVAYRVRETSLNEVLKRNKVQEGDHILRSVHQHVTELNKQIVEKDLVQYDQERRSAILKALKEQEFKPDKKASEKFLLEHGIKDSTAVLESRKYEILRLQEETLRQIFSEGIQDRTAVVISIAGAFRKGKSFLLNLFLRYMNHVYGSEKLDECQWLGNREARLTGFSWSGGSKRQTTGIVMWSKIFCATLPDGKEIAVIFLDTQGTFDCQSPMRQNAIIFALSTLVSSVQIYNLSHNIQGDDLQHLELFIEYGRLVLEETSNIPFQKLLFLIRDWQWAFEANYGFQGGQKKLDEVLQITDEEADELKSVKKHIKSCFEKIECFLMPYPGTNVTQSEEFDGRISAIDPIFITHLQTLVPSLLSPNNLVPKKVDGHVLTIKDFEKYLTNYTNLFNSSEVPNPRSLLEITADANNSSAMIAAKGHYQQKMDESCNKKTLDVEDLQQCHIINKEEALKFFEELPKICVEEVTELYRDLLEQEIEEIYKRIKAHNATKLTIRKIKNYAKGTITIGIGIASAILFKRIPPF